MKINDPTLESHYLKRMISRVILQIYFQDYEDEELIDWLEDHPYTFEPALC